MKKLLSFLLFAVVTVSISGCFWGPGWGWRGHERGWHDHERGWRDHDREHRDGHHRGEDKPAKS